MSKLVVCLAAAAALFVASPSFARDFFVRAGAEGDGSMQNPFGDPWQALDQAQAGDSVHIAGGKYFGRLNNGMWEVLVDDLSILGGYDASFKTRDPWKNKTELLWDKKSKNRPNQERILSRKKNTTIDGVVIDQRDQCPYGDEQQTSRKEYPSCDSAIRYWLPGTVRNSVIINPGFDGMTVPAGSTVENNLIVNSVNWGINLNTLTGSLAVSTIKNNTIAFTMSFKEPGKGGYAGSGIGLKAPANVTGNIIAFSDQNGIYMPADAEKTTLADNVFFMNLFSNVKMSVDGKEMGIDDKQMDLLEEAGFKKVSNNDVKNPQLPVDSDWLDQASKRTSASPGKLEMDDFNKARQLMGLPMIEKGGKPASGVAPAYDLEAAMKLMNPKGAGNAGARVKALTVSFAAVAEAAPAKNYKKVSLASWSKSPDSVNGQPLEMVVGIEGTANVRSIPSQFKPDDYGGTTLHDSKNIDERVIGFWKKGTTPERLGYQASMQWSGSGTPPKLYVVKGTAYALSGYPKAGFQIDSIEPMDESVADTSGRPKGKDWFVRAGSSGGDGSKDKPFKDPWQALEKVEAGDFIHVAEGEYYGKLKTGRWKIDTQYISLIGGYDKTFTERNPWKHPTRLFAPADYKGRRQGYVIEGDGDTTGAVLDGFVIDRATDNVYKANGDLDYDNSTKDLHVWLNRPGSIIRNCVFSNGAEGAIRTSNGVTMENNIFINHQTQTVVVQRGFGSAPFVFRNNTVAFSWEIRFGEGNGRNGHLLSIENGINAIIDNNIFEFADNDAIRLMADPADVELTNNTFNHNLWSNVMRPQGNQTVDDETFGQLKDFKFKKLSGNQVISAGLPVDQKWFEAYLNRTAYVPGKVSMDEWNQLREMIGQPVLATGGQGPSGFMPLYPWDKAIKLFPKNPKVTAGARAKDLPVSFTGVDRVATDYEYQDMTWADTGAQSADVWNKLDGKRVSLVKVVIRSTDNQVQLAGFTTNEYTPFTVTGPEGMDSGGLPVRMYVKKGSTAERKVLQAKSYSSGMPEQWYTIKGVMKNGRQMVAEVVERAD